VRETSPEILRAWAPVAGAIADASRAEAEGVAGAAAASGSALVLGGLPDERSRRALRELQGRAEVVALVQVGSGSDCQTPFYSGQDKLLGWLCLA
jgi:hypothetical protein